MENDSQYFLGVINQAKISDFVLNLKNRDGNGMVGKQNIETGNKIISIVSRLLEEQKSSAATFNSSFTNEYIAHQEMNKTSKMRVSMLVCERMENEKKKTSCEGEIIQRVCEYKRTNIVLHGYGMGKTLMCLVMKLMAGFEELSPDERFQQEQAINGMDTTRYMIITVSQCFMLTPMLKSKDNFKRNEIPSTIVRKRSGGDGRNVKFSIPFKSGCNGVIGDQLIEQLNGVKINSTVASDRSSITSSHVNGEIDVNVHMKNVSERRRFISGVEIFQRVETIETTEFGLSSKYGAVGKLVMLLLKDDVKTDQTIDPNCCATIVVKNSWKVARRK